MANHNKNNDWKTFLPTQTSSKESFTLIVQYPGTTPVQYFPKLKNPDGSNVIGANGRPQRSPRATKAGRICSHTLELVTVSELFLMDYMT